jgi:catechol 2,3-dioxygenase-like lactoylglutathione lyase family enzyme
MPIAAVRLNHAVLFVADLARAEHFYTEVFGMEVAAREPRANAAFLRLPRSGNHHDLGLFGVGPAASPKRRGGIGLYHLAWQVDTIDELVLARKTLAEAGALRDTDVVDALGGLPRNKMHCSVLAEDVIRAALEDYGRRQEGKR